MQVLQRIVKSVGLLLHPNCVCIYLHKESGITDRKCMEKDEIEKILNNFTVITKDPNVVQNSEFCTRFQI